MKVFIQQNGGGGAAKVESEWTVNCHIECGFTSTHAGIRFSFPFVINAASFNYNLTIEPDKDQRDNIFANPTKL